MDIFSWCRPGAGESRRNCTVPGGRLATWCTLLLTVDDHTNTFLRVFFLFLHFFLCVKYIIIRFSIKIDLIINQIVKHPVNTPARQNFVALTRGLYTQQKVSVTSTSVTFIVLSNHTKSSVGVLKNLTSKFITKKNYFIPNKWVGD